MTIDLKKLEQILTVARTGNFTRAAEELYISQPALSRSIHAVEARFGIRLFERGRTGAVLTPVGKMAVEEAAALLRQARTYERNLQLYGRGEAGRVAFGMGPLIGSMLLPGLSTHLVNRWPRLIARASVKAVPVLMSELLGNEVELLFCSREQVAGEQGISIETMGALRIVMLVRAEHPLAQHRQVSLADILRFAILSGAELSATARRTSGGAFICDNYHLLRETALQSDGVWITSERLAAADLAAGRLLQLEVVDSPVPPRIEVCMTQVEGMMLSPAATAVAQYVRDYFQPG